MVVQTNACIDACAISVFWNQLRRNMPVRHESLSPEDGALCRKLWARLGTDSGVASLEAWEFGFLRDANPGRELRLWAAIADCADEAVQATGTARKRIVGLICALSNGACFDGEQGRRDARVLRHCRKLWDRYRPSDHVDRLEVVLIGKGGAA